MVIRFQHCVNSITAPKPSDCKKLAAAHRLIRPQTNVVLV